MKIKYCLPSAAELTPAHGTVVFMNIFITSSVILGFNGEPDTLYPINGIYIFITAITELCRNAY